MVCKRMMYTLPQKTEPKKQKPSKEEVSLMNELEKQSPSCPLYVYVNSAIIPLLPLWTFVRILDLDMEDNALRVLLVSTICSCLLWLATNEYKMSVAGKLKPKTDKTRPKTVMNLLNEDKSVRDEACGFALFYNNCNFLALAILFGHVGFQKLPVEDNYAVSMLLAAFVVAILSSTLRNGKK